MVWEKRVRRLAWVFSLLMAISFAYLMYAALIVEDQDGMFLSMVLFFIAMTLFALLLFGSFTVGRFEKENIKRKGIPAKATILRISETGTRLNDQPLLRIELEVQPPYDSRFTTTVEYIVPYLVFPQLEPGKTVQVYYMERTKEVAVADL